MFEISGAFVVVFVLIYIIVYGLINFFKDGSSKGKRGKGG